MTAYIQEELVKLEESLQQIAVASDNNLQRAERSYCSIQATLQRVKEFIVNYTFKDLQEEIRFFKEIKPQFLSELIYYMKLFYVEADRPVGNREMHVSYYKLAVDRINVFFERNHTFYIYYRMGKSDQDTKYFVRTTAKLELLPEYSLDNDPKFSNVYSYKLAKIQAYERLNEYLLQTLYLLENPTAGLTENEKEKKPEFMDGYESGAY